jgi:hypothetical protein
MTGSVEPYFSNRTFSSPKPGQFLCQRLVWLNCLLSPTQEALSTDGLGFTSICLTRTQVILAVRRQESEVRSQKLEVRSQEIGDYFIYSPHTPHPTPHFLTSPHPTSSLPHTPHPTPHQLW